MKEITRRSAAVKWWDPRSIAWWLFVAAVVLGGYVMVTGLAPGFKRFPVTGVTALVLSVPMFVLVWYLVKAMQIVTRPARSAALAAVVWGGLVATGVFAINANGAIILALAQHVSLDFSTAWGAAIAAPITEETGKLLGVVAVVIAARAWLRGPMDGFLLGALVGLGFALTENVLYAFNVTALNLGESQPIATLIIYGVRTGLFWPVSHALFTGLAGAALGFWLGRPGARSAWWGVLSLVAAYGIHFVWNSPMLPGFLARMGFASLIPLIVWLVIHRARKAEAAWVRGVLANEVANGTLPAAWLDTLGGTLVRRRRHRKALASRYGQPMVQAQRSLEGLMVDLADAVDAGDQAHAQALRERLAQLVEGARQRDEAAAAEAARQQQALAEYNAQVEAYRAYWAQRGYRV